MATIGTIAINVVARTGNLKKGLSRSASTVNSFSRSVSSLGVGLVKIGAPIAAAAAGFFTLHKAISGVASQFEAIDEIAKSADKLGFATEEFIALQHGAELSGVSVEAFEKAMQKMTQGVFDATHGTGAAREALQSLGLDANKLLNAGPAASLNQIADALEGVVNPSERLALTMDLFGTRGADMVNMLRGGSGSLAQFRLESEQLGISLNRVEAEKIEMANDAMTRLQALFTGIARRIAVELAPFLQFAVEKFVAFGTEGEGAAGKVRAGVDFVIAGLGFMLDAIDLVRTAWSAMKLGALLATEGLLVGVAAVVRGVEFAAETIATVFRSAFAHAQQIVSEAVGSLINLLSRFVSFIESTLPERFRLGLGNVAKEFSQAFDSTIAANREKLEATDFGVDFNLGGKTATAFADTFSDGVRVAEKEFNEFANREKLSEQMRRGVDEIRKKADAAASGATAAADHLAVSANEVAATQAPEALERGSQEAFKAFAEAQKGGKTDVEILAENRRIREAVEIMSRHPVVMGVAGL